MSETIAFMIPNQTYDSVRRPTPNSQLRSDRAARPVCLNPNNALLRGVANDTAAAFPHQATLRRPTAILCANTHCPGRRVTQSRRNVQFILPRGVVADCAGHVCPEQQMWRATSGHRKRLGSKRAQGLGLRVKGSRRQSALQCCSQCTTSLKVQFAV